MLESSRAVGNPPNVILFGMEAEEVYQLTTSDNLRSANMNKK